MKLRLSVAIIGTGNIAGGFDEKKRDEDTGIYSHAGAYAAHGGFDLKTVYDPDQERAENFRQTWQASGTAADLDVLCGCYHDVISICSPDSTHFDIMRQIMDQRCCSTIFAEKPLALEIGQIEELISLAASSGIRIVVNFQRRNETRHREIREAIASRPQELLSVTCHYIKGLHHIGVTMLDTLCYLCGYPEAVLAFNRVFNKESGDYSYEFVLFYPGFTVTAKTIDSESYYYNYHIFEIDMLFLDKRMALVDSSQWVRESAVTSFAYSGVKVISEHEATYRETCFKTSMLDAVGYIYDITTDLVAHETNTPCTSYNNHLIINRIVESFDRGSIKLNMEQDLWKK